VSEAESDSDSDPEAEAEAQSESDPMPGENEEMSRSDKRPFPVFQLILSARKSSVLLSKWIV
jgi:hypothetical protein